MEDRDKLNLLVKTFVNADGLNSFLSDCSEISLGGHWIGAKKKVLLSFNASDGPGLDRGDSA